MKKKVKITERPIISTYHDMVGFMEDMLVFRKSNEKSFSILRASKHLRRVSPTLVSLMLQRKRKITLDRADELAKLLGLTPHERQYFKDWINRINHDDLPLPLPTKSESLPRRKLSSTQLLSDWVNVYVKDAFQLKKVKQDPKEIYATLAGIASQKRIDKAIKFLLRAGYLRKDLNGEIVEESPLHVVDHKVSSQKVRQFHKGALKTALKAMDQYTSEHRYANALILPLDETSYRKLTALVEEIAENLQKFAEATKDGERLYQIIINLSPTGGFRD